MTDPDTLEYPSSTDFPATLECLTRAIEAAGLTVFARIDHAIAAREAGLSMPQALVLIYGNANGGTPIMLEQPLAALDLPLRVLVREAADSRVWVAFHPIVPMLARAGISAGMASRLEPAQRLLIEAIQARD